MGQTDEPAGRIWREEKGRRGLDGGGNTKAQLLTSFAATLLDPLRVCDVVVTSFAVEKCSKSDAVTVFSTHN